MKALGKIINAVLRTAAVLLAGSSVSCENMTQQQAGQNGGLVGAGLGALVTGAAAKSSGANGGQTLLASAIGGVAGYKVGQNIGQQNGASGVYKTTVPQQ